MLNLFLVTAICLLIRYASAVKDGLSDRAVLKDGRVARGHWHFWGALSRDIPMALLHLMFLSQLSTWYVVISFIAILLSTHKLIHERVYNKTVKNVENYKQETKISSLMNRLFPGE